LPRPSVGLCVRLSGKRTVAKRLTGFRCHLGCWVGSVEDGSISWGWWLSKQKGSFGVNLGCHTVTNGDSDMLFPN